ncbi:MAG: Crp/Fnr family transcriptional regulator [Epsilonproteobacteria bacterium]|nr:Crp/Fnr family transcriptional regulator [Campylobacterota bacterium]
MITNTQFLGPFEGANSYLKKEFEENGTIIKFDKDNHPFDVDSTLKWFFIIISGKVKIYEINFETNREQTLYLLVKGDMYDVVTLLDNRPHEVMVDVLEKGEAIRFPINKVREWMRKFPAFEQLIYKYIATQIRNVEHLAIDLSLYDTKERLLKLLLRNVETLEKKGVNILEKLSHSEIANLIGTVRHIIDRHLKELKDEKIIEKEKRKIVLKDAKKLLEMLKSY